MYKKAPRVKRGKDGKYFMRPQDIVNTAKKLENVKYRIGENSAGEEDLFQVIGENGMYFTGNWASGEYSVAVFKKHLRKLTDEEIALWNSRSFIICGVKVPLNVTRD